MADEKRNREENEDLNKNLESDLDELDKSTDSEEERENWDWLYEADEDDNDLEADNEDGKEIDLDAMIDEILNHIAPNDWEEWKDQPARETPPPAAAPQQPTPTAAAPTDKTRKKQRRSLPTNIAEGVIYVGGILLISFILATIGWRWAGDVLALNKEPLTASVTITEGESLGDVTAELKEKGLVKYGYLFQLFASFTHKAEKITAGSYELSTVMDYSALLNNISSTSAYRETVTVTIPEGYTVEEIFKLMENKGVCSYNDLLKVAQEETFDFDFLKDVKTTKEKRLEGYLFPDTYEFYKGADAKSVINTMLKNFDERFDSKMEAEMQLLGYSKNDIIIMASIIEKETDGGDQRNIASVLQNRLKNTWATPKGYLQVDSTIQYLLKERKKKLTDKDLEIDSPYNTYKNPGLPIGPICNPGLTAIQAALEPNKTNYYYFMLGKDGTTHFFDTEAAFLAFKAEQQD